MNADITMLGTQLRSYIKRWVYEAWGKIVMASFKAADISS
jgi:hypothetical protein